jgi:lipooligosaccharide transport system permease protein
VRDVVVLGVEPLADLGHLAFLVAFGLAMWRLAIWRLRKRLID